MKKITALVLALVMTLSLLPMTVWATDGGGDGSGMPDNGSTPSDISTPVFTSNRAFGQAGVFIFSRIDPENHQLICGNDVQGIPNGITVNCANQERKTVFLAANKYDTLTVNGATLPQENGVWYDGDMACNIYVLDVSKPASGSVVEYTVTRSWFDGGEQSNFFTLAFDFSPVFTSDRAFGQAGVFFFGSLDEENNELIGGNAIMGSPEGVVVACANQERKTIFLAANKHDTLSVSDATLRPVDGVWFAATPEGEMACNIYALDASKPETGSVVEYTVTRTSTWYENDRPVSRSETFPLVFDFDRQPGSGGEQGGGEDTTYWKTYHVKYAGNSTFTVRLSELQAQVLTLPDEINENNELIITVHNAAKNNEAVWRELVKNDDLMVGYFFDSMEDEGVAKPKVKSLGTDGSIAEALAWLDEYPYVDYNFPSGRYNGVNFAWASAEGDRTVVIPTENMMVSSWIWGYDNGDGTYTEKPDGVIVKLVLDKDVSNAIVLEEEKLPAAEAERVKLVGHYGLDAGPGPQKIFSGSYDETTGIFTYQYTGNVPADQGFVSAAINNIVINRIEQNKSGQTSNGAPFYQLLKVTAPEGYTARYFSSQHFEGNVGGNEITLEYLWLGLGTEMTYTLVWGKDNSDEEYVEQITVAVPTVAGVETWMDHINETASNGTNCATAVPNANVIINQVGMAESGAESSYSNGVLWTDFAEGEMLNVEAIEATTISVKIPDAAVAYRLARPGDGADDPTYNENNKWAPDDFQSNLEASERVVLQGTEKYIEDLRVYALNEQNIGDIQYYYSADRGTWLILIKWIFDGVNENNGAKYEWIRLDTENYFCQWEEELMEDSEVTNEVEVPTATTEDLADSDIKLIARIHPQKQEDGYGQYFFQLEMVKEGEGNVYTDPNGDTYFTIILPYSFMGEDWNYAKAKNLKEKPMITHFDKEFRKLTKEGEITGEYTERGIEFKVNSFSPFTVSWTEETKETAGGYTPSVTPDVSVNIDSGSLNEAALAVGSAINNGSADIAPAAGYTKADIEKLQQESKLRMSIEKASDCSATDKETIDAAISKAAGTAAAPAAQYFDITVVLKHEDTGATVGKVRDTKTPISITVDLNSELQQAARAGKYLYVVRCHDGKTAFLKAELNTDKTKVTFSTSLFSAYAVVALDKEVPVEAASAAKPVTPPAQEPMAPAPEDTAPEVKPDAPVVDEPAVDEAPVVDTEPSGNAGLWIGVGIVALAAIVVVLVVMAARKKRKN